MVTGPLRDDQPKDLPVRVFIDLTRFDLPWSALRELGQRGLVGSEAPRKTVVDFVVRDTTIGTGKLTALGIGLGVRITRI